MRHIFKDLALNSLSKNKAIYIPYIIAITTMYVITYSITALSSDSYIGQNLRGGSNLQMIMSIGIFIVFNVALIFLFNINRFIDKKRRKELGIYGILGLEKRHIRRVAFIENAVVYSFSIAIGTIISIVISKLLQLIILKSLDEPVDFDWSINIPATILLIVMFLIIFTITEFDSIISLQRTNLLDYMREERKGEKQPKSKWITATIGFILLALGYVMSFMCGSAGAALNMFFIAVMLVIMGTYLLFRAGSITLLNTLKKNKNYYYQTKHFISISGILYRMKRNATDLATICIFSTMFLVTMSSAISLYVTMNQTIDGWYLKDFFFTYECDYAGSEDKADIEGLEDATNPLISTATDEINHYSELTGVKFDEINYYHEYNTFSELTFDEDSHRINCDDTEVYNAELYNVYFITLECYNQANASNAALAPDEIGIHASDSDNIHEGYEITFGSDNDSVYKIKTFDEVPKIFLGSAITVSNGTIFVIFPDNESIINALKSFSSSSAMSAYSDLIVSATTSASVSDQLKLADSFDFANSDDEGDPTVGKCLSKYATSKQIVGFYSGIFFVGIFLSLAFVIVTVLILYFKQLFEGYEDAAGFAIMRKVGLTKKEIRKSINSQVLLMFFLPLIVAIIHTFAAFPMVSKLLTPFGHISPMKYFGILMLVVLFFSIIYSIAYLFTGRVYSKLVNGAYSSRKVF